MSVASVSLAQLSQSLAKNLECLTKDKNVSFLTLLITFWHAVLNLAVEFEDSSLKLATQYRAKHRLNSTPWKMQEFAEHLKNINDKKFNRVLTSIDNVPLSDGFSLMPFLMTMRLEAWFDEKMYDINCSLQLLIRFEASYIAQSRRRFASVELLPNNYAMDLLLRHVWHTIISCYAMVYNNSFAFCLESLLSTTKVMWRDHVVTQVVTVAGSLLKPTKFFSRASRVFAHNNGTFEETTWIVLSLCHEATGERRILQCSLTQNSIASDFYFKPLLPLMVLPPFPLVDKEFSSVVSNPESLAQEIVQHSIPPIIVKMAILWTRGEKFQEKNSAYRVDRLCEITLIGRRMQDLFHCMVEGANAVANLQFQLQQTVATAKKSGNKKKEIATYIDDVTKRTNDDCTLIIHVRDNSAAMFGLLKSMTIFNVMNV